MTVQRFPPPDGLSRRAEYFIAVHGARLTVPKVDDWPAEWRAAGVAEEVTQSAAVYQARWGGLTLPPAPEYDGGPWFLLPNAAEKRECSAGQGWWYEAGPPRTALPYSFLVGPDGSFGIAESISSGDIWVPLHASVEGWVESVALAYTARMYAREVRRLSGKEVDTLNLAEMEPVAEVAGRTDFWWRGTGRLIAVYRGEAELFGRPDYHVAYVYTGLTRTDI